MFRRAVTLLPVVKASLRLYGFKKTKESLEERQRRESPQAAGVETDREQIGRTSRMVRSAAHYGIVQSSCLEESLTLWHLLRMKGYAAKLRIGVRKTAGKFEAHAWVEHEGVALNQTEEMHRHYAAFESEFPDQSGDST